VSAASRPGNALRASAMIVSSVAGGAEGAEVPALCVA